MLSTPVGIKFLLFFNERRISSRPAGLSLPEVLVVMVILGIVALIALPSLLNQRHKAQLAAAKATIGAVNRAQEAYRVRHKIFATKLRLLQIYDTSGGGYRVEGYEPLTLTYDEIRDKETDRILYGGGNPWYVSVHAQAVDPSGTGVSGCVHAREWGVTTASVKEGIDPSPPGDCWKELPESPNGNKMKFVPIQTTE